MYSNIRKEIFMMTRAELRCRYIEFCKACGLNDTGDDTLRMILEPAMRVELMECKVSSLQELKALAEKNAQPLLELTGLCS